MVVEAQWDRPNAPFRARVTACIDPPGHGEKIMASMGSLGHYMQEASASGFAIRDFLHEGNGDIWLAALQQPWPYADWILIEEKAEGGDMLAKIVRRARRFSTATRASARAPEWRSIDARSPADVAMSARRLSLPEPADPKVPLRATSKWKTR